jgi:HEAT repeat protein
MERDVYMKTALASLVAFLGCTTLRISTVCAQEPPKNGKVGAAQTSSAAGRSGDATSSAQIVALISDLRRHDYQKKVSAALQLRSHGADAKAAIPALIDNLDDIEDGAPQGYYWSPTVYNPQTAAVEALKKILPHANGSGLDYARKAYANGGFQLKLGITEVLPSYGAQGIPLLISILTSDDNYDVRRKAIEAFGNVGPAAVPALKELLDSDPPDEVRRQALLALVANSTGLPTRDKQDVRALPILLAALESAKGGLKQDLMEGIAFIATENEIDRLQTLLRDENMFVRRDAVYGLYHIGSPKALNALRACRADTSIAPDTRDYAIQLLTLREKDKNNR